MQITIENEGGCNRLIKVNVDAETVSEKLRESFRDINRQVAFPGFRKGKAPRKLLEQRYGKEVADDIRQSLADDALKQALEEHALKVLGSPELEGVPEIKSGSPAELILKAEVYPEFELPKYKGIELERPETTVEEHEIHAQIRQEQINRGSMDPVDGPTEDGSFIRADIEVVSDDKTVFQRNGGLIEAGFGWIAGLKPKNAKKALLGLKVGDEKELKANLPDDLPDEENRGKPAVIKLKVIEVLKVEGPSPEDIAQSLGFDDLEGWREKLESEIRKQKDADLDRVLEDRAIAKVTDAIDMELPAKYSEKKAEQLLQQQAFRLYQSGADENLIRELLAEGKERGIEDVKSSLKRAFVIDAISRKERIVVTEDELKREIERLASQVGRDAGEIWDEFDKAGRLSGMREEFKTAKVLKMLRQKAKYVEKGAAAEAAAEKED